jgi:hypothetical protein
MSANSLIYLVRPARFELATSRFVVIKQGVSSFRRCCLIFVTVSKMALFCPVHYTITIQEEVVYFTYKVTPFTITENQ